MLEEDQDDSQAVILASEFTLPFLLCGFVYII